MGREPILAEEPAGFEREFTDFYRERYPFMVRLAVLLVSRLDVAEELVQDSFAALYGHWAAVEEPSAYLRRTVVNRCHDALRRGRMRHKERWLTGPEVVQPVDHLGDVIAALPSSYRVVIVLRFYEGMTLEEIASATGSRLGTAKSQLHRALLRLRKVLEP